MKWLAFVGKFSQDYALLTHSWNINQGDIIDSIIGKGIISPAILQKKHINDFSCGDRLFERNHYVFAGVPKSLEPAEIIDSIFWKSRSKNFNFVIFYEERTGICYDYKEGAINHPFAKKRSSATIDNFQYHSFLTGERSLWEYSEFIGSYSIPTEKILAFTKYQRLNCAEKPNEDKAQLTKIYIESALEDYLFFPTGNGNNVLLDYDDIQKELVVRTVLEKIMYLGILR